RVAPPSSPGSMVPSPKIAVLERRKAMRFRNSIVSQTMPEANQHNLRLSALHAPHCFLRARLKIQPARGAGTKACVFFWREWGKPHARASV
ncbi:MAG: hypothetical protein V4661_06815, partial [Pseudomonadota bacterium]